MSLWVGIALGLGMGVLSGLGVGGGKLLIPVLVTFFAVSQQVAQGAALVAFIPIALVAAYVHYRHGFVDVEKALWLMAGSMTGAVVGAWIATHLSGAVLSKVYGYFLGGIAIYEFFNTEGTRVSPR